jgi:uncharacterized protein YjbJ (UPF0337 family)
MPQAGAVQTDVPQPGLDLAAHAQFDEQLRPAFSNLIVGYSSIDGSTWSRKFHKQGLYLVADAQCALDESQLIEPHPRTEERIMMKPSTDDKTTGNLHEIKGAIKQKTGELTDNPDLEADGRAEKNAGKVQKAIGKIEKAVGV